MSHTSCFTGQDYCMDLALSAFLSLNFMGCLGPARKWGSHRDPWIENKGQEYGVKIVFS